MKIKFCGIRRLEDVTAVNLCQPDYMGMIFAPQEAPAPFLPQIGRAHV